MTIGKKLLTSAIILTLSSSILTGCNQNTKTERTTSTKVTEVVYNDLFKKNEVMDVHIEISEDDWKDILENPLDEEYHSANITVGSTTLENIGIRTKGFSSLQSVASSESDRYSFRIKLDKYVDEQNLNGLDEFVLNNNFQDPSYMREYLSYKALETLGIDVPQTAYSNVYINGELFGFYLAIESIDDSFIERVTNNTSSDVRLYKADGENSTLVDEASLTNFELKNGEDDSMVNLKNLVSAINAIEGENKGDIESIFDVDSFLKSIAVNTVIGNYDSYSGSKAHNYFLLEEDGVFKYIPWDFNMAFGGFMEDNGASVTVSIDEPIYNVDSSKRPLIEKLLSIDEYKEKYYGYLKELVEYYDDFEKQVNDLATLIKPYIENDPTAFYTIKQFEQNIVASDTDLSTVENKVKGNNPGTPPTNTNGEAPTIPEDIQIPNSENPGIPPTNNSGEAPTIPEDMQIPNSENPGTPPTNNNGEAPAIPEGMQIPNGENDEESSTTNGQKPNKGGGMNLSGNVVSIIDYLQQRIENIKSQLN